MTILGGRKMGSIREKYKNRHEEMRKKKGTYALYIILRVIVISLMVFQIYNGQYENFFVCLLTLILMEVPTIVQKKLRVELPSTLEVIIVLFIFAAEILGELNAFYVKFPRWDTMLHTMNGFLMAAIGFSLVDMFNREEKFSIKLAPTFQAIVAFCFSMTIGVIWEFFEWGMDSFFYLDMQKDRVITQISSVLLDPTNSNIPVQIKDITATTVNGELLKINGYLDIGLNDTMKDLLVNFVGAIVFSIIGYIFIKNRGKGKGKFAARFIPSIQSDKDVKELENNEEKKDVK